MTVIKDKTKEPETFKVAVYGSLRKGMGNHPVISDGKLLGSFESEPIYTMYSVHGSYPALMEEGTTSITMEVYEVDSTTLWGVNSLEGFNEPDDPMNFYNRKEVETPYGKAFLFIYNNDVDDLHVVESGDWVKFKSVSDFVNT